MAAVVDIFSLAVPWFSAAGTAVPPELTSATSATGFVGSAFSYTATYTPGDAAVAWSNLPGWLTADGDTVSGTPSAAGTTTITVTLTSEGGEIVEQITLAIATPLRIDSSLSLVRVRAQALTYTAVTIPADATLTWGTLPGWLSASGKTLSGTPTTNGVTTIDFTVESTQYGIEQSLDETLTITVTDPRTRNVANLLLLGVG